MTIVPSRLLAATAALALLAWPGLSSAESQAAERAGRGIAGILVPFLEIPGNITHTARHEGNAKAWTEGFARGLGMSLLRPPVGFYELVTAPFPKLADDPPVLLPKYPWSYFQEGRTDAAIARR